MCSHHHYHHQHHHDEVDFLRHSCFVAICFRSERSVCKQPEELRGPWSRHQRVPAQNLGRLEEPHAHRDPRAQPEADRALQDQQPQVQNSARSRNLDRLDFYRREYKIVKIVFFYYSALFCVHTVTFFGFAGKVWENSFEWSWKREWLTDQCQRLTRINFKSHAALWALLIFWVTQDWRDSV